MAAVGGVGCGSDSTDEGAGGAGGSDDAGTDAPVEAAVCATTSFVSPTAGATLTEKDDAGGALCASGFHHDVVVATNAPDGTAAVLFANSAKVATAKVSGAQVTFANVSLDSNGKTQLKVQIGAATCTTTESVTVACAASPTCTVSKPDHTLLNGVAAALGGDRASSDGSPYQAVFEVTTNVEDGQPVALAIGPGSTTLLASASAGKAQFQPTLVPDGEYTAQATCTRKSGQKGVSSKGTYTVETASPEIATTSPADGSHFDPADDADTAKAGLQFAVCGTTSSADALDVAGARASNFCAAIGSQSPACAPATAAGSPANGACVLLDCPGGAPFDVTVKLTDAAGNVTTKTIQGVSCSSTLPGVQIVDPVDGTGADVSTHVLGAASANARKDADAATAGAQYTVVACSDRAAGQATLFAGLATGATAAVAGPVALEAAQAADGCPSGYPSVARFVDATLPQSTEGADGALQTATRLRVDVTDESLGVGSSAAVDLWVDSVDPVLSPFTPNPLCGGFKQSASAYSVDVTLSATAVPVTLTVTGGTGTRTYTGSVLANARTDFGTVVFDVGDNAVAATVTEPSGNQGALEAGCTFTVGNPPVVTFVSPPGGAPLGTATDADAATAGWQGTLSVHTDAPAGTTVQFSTDVGGAIGAPATVDASGNATLAGATIPDGAAVKLTATTSFVSGRGQGVASETLAVDTVTPGGVGALTPTVKDRRATSFHLAWTAPSDGGSAVAGYDVRVSGAAITAGNFAAATSVAYAGAPSAPGAADGVDVTGRLIETDHYFAVQPLDKGGNRGPIVSAGPIRATFNSTLLQVGTAATDLEGFSTDGSSSLNGDAFSDLVVGSQNLQRVYVYFGAATGYAASPSVTISGAATLFGYSVTVVGDVDGDGLADLAVASRNVTKVFIFKGRASWPATLDETQADYVVDGTGVGGFFGISVAKLGDFDGDGADDFAVGSSGVAGNAGRVTIVKGVKAGTAFGATLTLPAAYGTRAIKIDGGTAGERFGYAVLGAGKWLNGAGNTLVVLSPTLTNASRVYAFHGQAGTAGDIPLATADATADIGPSGRGGLTLLGSLGTSDLGVGAGASAWSSTGGKGWALMGNATAGAFSSAKVSYTDSKATSLDDQFGVMVLGGGFSGTSTSVSFIGGPETDVVLSSRREAGAAAKLYFLTGPHALAASSIDVATSADVVYALPSDWAGSSFKSSPIKDVDGDGYGDLAIGEFDFSATASYAGRVLVLW